MAAVTANTLQITQQSAQLFEDANNSLGQIYSQVSEAQETLKGQAMVTTAGARLSQAIVLWTRRSSWRHPMRIAPTSPRRWPPRPSDGNPTELLLRREKRIRQLPLERK
jgi:hypothetical protein